MNDRLSDHLAHSDRALRAAIGVIAMAMPLALLAVHAMATYRTAGQTGFLTSISQAYYREVSALFVGFLCAIGVFLCFYKGYERKDWIAMKLAGLCAIVVSQVPCGTMCEGPNPYIPGLWGWAENYPKAYMLIHFGAAAVMFAALAYTCLVLFTKSDHPAAEVPREKFLRNRIYRGCGFIIIVTMVMTSIDMMWPFGLPWFSITLIETIMIEAFGFAWLVKSEATPIFRDKHA